MHELLFGEVCCSKTGSRGTARPKVRSFGAREEELKAVATLASKRLELERNVVELKHRTQLAEIEANAMEGSMRFTVNGRSRAEIKELVIGQSPRRTRTYIAESPRRINQ